MSARLIATSSLIATSDRMYKTPVQTITYRPAIAQALRPIEFNLKPHPVHNFDLSTKTIGFLAQEVRAALEGKSYRDAAIKSYTCDMDGTEEEFLGIAEGNLISILISAVQELSVRVKELETKLFPEILIS